MERFTIYATYASEDWRAYQDAVARRVADSHSGWHQWLLALPRALHVAVLVVLLVALVLDWPRIVIVAALASLAALLFHDGLLALIARARADAGSGDTFVGDATLEFSRAGVRILRSDRDAYFRWSAVRDVESARTHLFVWIGSAQAIVLPWRDLTPHKPGDVLRWIRERAAGADDDEDPFTTTLPSNTPP